jgi:thiol:disulfide interchange protein
MVSTNSRSSLLFVTLFIAILVLVSCAKEGEEAGGSLKWLGSYDEALSLAKDKNRPVMIDFYADWCGWCKRLDSDTYSDRSVVEKAQEFVSLKIDADVERGLSSRYRVSGLPTILFIDTAGREIHRVVGYRPAQGFLKEMDTALTAFKSGS